MKRFEIARTPEIQALIAKYENLGQDFVVSDEDLMVQRIASQMDEYSRVLWYAYTENHSILKLAKFFGTTSYKARAAIDELKAQVTKIMRNERNRKD